MFDRLKNPRSIESVTSNEKRELFVPPSAVWAGAGQVGSIIVVKTEEKNLQFNQSVSERKELNFDKRDSYFLL